jgi:uncharacterized membrane protein YeaQ/YmgE (transglycosylase-associated protein family)
MPIINTALAHLIIIVIIGILAGLSFNRFGQGWFVRNIGGSRHTDITTALVGIAGSFIGFHVGVVLELLPLPLMQYLLALIGSLVVLWVWRGR